jgi:hypothetical protein
MKIRIVVALLLGIMLMIGSFSTSAHAQTPGTDLKPTFISPTPGLYVHGWPAFTVSYPKEWVELPPAGNTVLSVGAPRQGLPPFPALMIRLFPSPLPLEDWAKIIMPAYQAIGTDIKVISDKPSQLKDGTPAREVKIDWVVAKDPSGRSITNGPSLSAFLLVTKREAAFVWVVLAGERGGIGEDLKKHIYSLAFQPSREEPVKVPLDVGAFLDMWCADVGLNNVEALMAHFSDRYFQSGGNKANMERTFRSDRIPPLTSCEPTVTVFEPQGDKAYVDGFFLSKAKGSVGALKIPMAWQQIIKEHGQWKWFGNQK